MKTYEYTHKLNDFKICHLITGFVIILLELAVVALLCAPGISRADEESDRQAQSFECSVSICKDTSTAEVSKISYIEDENRKEDEKNERALRDDPYNVHDYNTVQDVPMSHECRDTNTGEMFLCQE